MGWGTEVERFFDCRDVLESQATTRGSSSVFSLVTPIWQKELRKRRTGGIQKRSMPEEIHMKRQKNQPALLSDNDPLQ